MDIFPKEVAIKNNYSETDLMLQKSKKIIDNPNVNKNIKVSFIIVLIILFAILSIIHFKLYSNNWINDYEDENMVFDDEII